MSPGRHDRVAGPDGRVRRARLSSTGADDDGAAAGRAVAAWPAGAAVVGLVARPSAGEAACEAAARLAEASYRDRRTLLANLAAGGPDLDGHLGTQVEAGLASAGRSGRSLREVAVRPEGWSFLYLPAGPPPGDAEQQREAPRVRLVALMSRVAERVRRRDARLLVFLAEDAGWSEGLADVLDGLVLLHGAALPRWAGRAAEVVGRYPPAEAAGQPTDRSTRGAGADDGPPGDRRPPADGHEPAGSGSWRRHRREAGLPWTRIAVGVAAVAVLAAGWWWLARETMPADGEVRTASPAPATDSAPGPTRGAAAAAAAPGGVESGQATGGDTAGGNGAGADGELPPALRSAPALPYSVLIASYAEWPQARERLRQWRTPGGPVYFVAPTRVRGGLYWRLFAGAEPDRDAGTDLMERLVEQGRKDRARAWDVRPVELAFLTGVDTSRSRARDRARDLEERGLPAYVLPAASDGDTTWAVYAGGYESSGEAGELRGRLAEAGIEADLVTRRGESGTR